MRAHAGRAPGNLWVLTSRIGRTVGSHSAVARVDALMHASAIVCMSVSMLLHVTLCVMIKCTHSSCPARCRELSNTNNVNNHDNHYNITNNNNTNTNNNNNNNNNEARTASSRRRRRRAPPGPGARTVLWQHGTAEYDRV